MQVLKRSGKKVDVNYQLITKRIEILAAESPALTELDASKVAQKTIQGFYDGISTEEIDQLAAETSGVMSIHHPEYGALASRILISNLHKTTPEYMEAFDILVNYIDPKTGEHAPLISEDLMEIAREYQDDIDSFIDYQKDYLYDYMGINTLTRSYLLKAGGRIIERPQTMLLRVSLGIWGRNMSEVRNTYEMMSDHLFTHATPTLFNAGTTRPQLSSCFLIANKGDSLDGIMDTTKDVARISSLAGGIGIHVHDVRAEGSYIKGSGGTSKGLLPLLRTYNQLSQWWDQGGNRRKGSFAIYLEPWHADIEMLVDMRKNHGVESERARDLFSALWVPDLFMERVESDGDWTLMCPNECKGLSDVYGDEFKELYEKYESEGLGRKTIKAQKLWEKIVVAQMETGTPYMCYKDAANIKSNQKNIGVIKSSNLCTEIMEVSTPDEQAVCNLGSLALPKFLKLGFFNFDTLWHAAYQLTVNLNKVIDVNFYPTVETKTSNFKHRPIGIGVQGLADVFAMLGMPFESSEAKMINDDIFETIYHAALTASNEQALQHGAYSTFKGSPASIGILQFDMWNKGDEVMNKKRYDWNSLKENIARHGLRNSLLMAPMPTASTAQILGNNECFEPFTSNLYTRRVLSGEFVVINKHLVKDFMAHGLWTPEMVQKLMAENGSVQNIPEVPTHLKELYKTVWEMSMKTIIDMAADRGKYICQSQSMNLFVSNANAAKMGAMHFYGWKKGLKTGMYYLRTKSAVDAIKFTLDKSAASTGEIKLEQSPSDIACSIDNPDDCEACGA